MSTYVISDTHGDYHGDITMLKKIDLKDDNVNHIAIKNILSEMMNFMTEWFNIVKVFRDLLSKQLVKNQKKRCSQLV